MPIKVLILVFVLFPAAQIAAGQGNYAVKSFTTDNGLANNYVKSLAQDRNGFLWIGTLDGLSRYDGYEFRNYYHQLDDTTTLAHFQVNKVLVDAENNVWAGFEGYLSRYNRTTDNFTRVNKRPFSGWPVLDRHGKLFCMNEAGIASWDTKAQKFGEPIVRWLDHPDVFNKAKIRSFEFDNTDCLWIDGLGRDDMDRLYRLIPAGNGKQFTYIGSFEMYTDYKLQLAPKLPFKPFVTKKGDWLLLSKTGIFKANLQTRLFELVNNVGLDKLLEGCTGEDIAFVRQYVACTNPTLGGSQSVKPGRAIVEDFLVDSQQNIWQSIQMKEGNTLGLTRNIPTPSFFRHYFMEYNPPGQLNAFFPVMKDKYGTIWGGAANLNEIFMKDASGKERLVVPMGDDIHRIARRPRSFLEDSTGVWTGYFGGVLLRYGYKDGKFKPVVVNRTGLADRSMPHSFVHLVAQKDYLLVVGFTDFSQYYPREGRFVSQYQPAYDSINIYSFTRDSREGWWVGASYSKLFYLDNSFNCQKTYILNQMPGFNLESIVEGDDNDLWISTFGGGIARFDKATGKTKKYTTADGLSNNTCYGMMKDRRGNIWVSTNHGISRFDPLTGQFRAFGPEDGLKIDEFNSDNTFQAPDGEMLFGGMGGVAGFYPDSIYDQTSGQKPRPLLIEELRVSGSTRYFKKAVYECDTVVLSKGDNNFKLLFSCLDFQHAEKVKYRYRVAELNNEFQYTDHRNRTLNYVNLAPGSYHLEIEATNRNGEWISKTALLVVIPAFFYQQSWFWLLVVLILLLLSGSLIYNYNQRIRLREAKKQDELRLESLRGQMNPHFIFNSLNSINYFISQNDRLSANRYIADFARLIRSILGNLSSDYIPLEKELESLRDYLQLEHLRFGDKFDYSVAVDDSLDLEGLEVTPGMVQPFVENAIWHGVRGLTGRKGFLRLEFRTGEIPGSVQCVVTDDGIGRKLSMERKSLLPGKTSRGIGIVAERLKIINGLRNSGFRIRFQDYFPEKDETGTVVILDIPVRRI